MPAGNVIRYRPFCQFLASRRRENQASFRLEDGRSRRRHFASTPRCGIRGSASARDPDGRRRKSRPEIRYVSPARKSRRVFCPSPEISLVKEKKKKSRHLSLSLREPRGVTRFPDGNTFHSWRRKRHHFGPGNGMPPRRRTTPTAWIPNTRSESRERIPQRAWTKRNAACSKRT